ncbi:MAG: hypothetical protein A2104_10380 [Candidatus Melainabacteria bacterium GWF2_32_7]|nr:MAG: hypothetical protein A2104_10380 [Candidatus Melainabacteria bacterium GWF2_32_7]
MLRVILVGYGELASSLMLGVLESKHELVGILRWEKTKSNKLLFFLKNIFWPDQLSSLIKANKISEIEAESINSEKFIKKALKLQPDVIIIGSWGEVIKKNTIILPKIACINCHPSLLPKHRGSNPYASTIIQGETKSGITFHLVNEKLDEGPILLQKEIVISNDDTGGSLRTKCSYTAKEAIKELLEGLENARFLPQKQNEKEASYFPQLTENDAKINWNSSAQSIYNQIRGLNPWMKCYTRYKDQFFMINSSKIIDLKKPVHKPGKILVKSSDDLLVSTADPKKAILLKNIEIYGFLGKLLSRFYIRFFVKTGNFLGK